MDSLPNISQQACANWIKDGEGTFHVEILNRTVMWTWIRSISAGVLPYCEIVMLAKFSTTLFYKICVPLKDSLPYIFGVLSWTEGTQSGYDAFRLTPSSLDFS